MDPSSGEVTARACGVLPDISALAPTLGSIQPPRFLSTIRFGLYRLRGLRVPRRMRVHCFPAPVRTMR